MESLEYSVEPMLGQHIDDALELCRNAGWNQLREDWQRLLDYEPEGCFVAIRGGKVIGTVTTTSYGRNLAWIGMMLVHAEFRRRGIATRLMEHSIQYLEAQGVCCIRLDATPAGETVYRQLGFQAEWLLHRWQRAADVRVPPTISSKPQRPQATMAERSILDAAQWQLDARAFGANRQRILEMLGADSHVICSGTGFGMLRRGFLADYLGPIAATDPQDVQTIVERLCQRTDRDIFWDVPAPNKFAEQLAQSLGFEPCRKLLRMRRGATGMTPEASLQYAIADPSLG